LSQTLTAGRLQVTGLFCLLAAAAVLAPYLLMEFIPGTDYANHLARLYALGASPGSPILASYAPHWALMPDLGLDLVYLALKAVASPEAVLRLCLVGTMAVILLCTWGIQRLLFGRLTTSCLLAPLCAGGLPVVMCNINFFMSIALVMIGVWVSLGWVDRTSPGKIVILAVIAAIAWITHFAGFATLMVFVGATEFSRRARPGRRFSGAAAAVLLTCAIAAPSLVLSLLAEHGAPAHQISYGLFNKLRILFAPIMATGTSTDFVLWAGMLAIIISLLRAGAWYIAPPARFALLVLTFLMLVLPCRVGWGYDSDSRLAVPIMLILLACSRIDPPRGARGQAILLAAVAGLIAGRDTWVLRQGRLAAAQMAAFRAADHVIPLSGHLMVAIDDHRMKDCTPAKNAFSHVGPNSNLVAYATIDRGAWEPFIFARRGMQPLRSVPAVFPQEPDDVVPPSLDRLGPDVQGNPVQPGWPGQFDDLLVIGAGCPANPFPALLREVASGPNFTLFRVIAASSPASRLGDAGVSPGR